jgi:hypothetical protein
MVDIKELFFTDRMTQVGRRIQYVQWEGKFYIYEEGKQGFGEEVAEAIQALVSELGFKAMGELDPFHLVWTHRTHPDRVEPGEVMIVGTRLSRDSTLEKVGVVSFGLVSLPPKEVCEAFAM